MIVLFFFLLFFFFGLFFYLSVFVFLCLQNTRHSLTGPSPEYRLKEKYYLRKIEIIDLVDTEGSYVMHVISTNGWPSFYNDYHVFLSWPFRRVI